MTTAITDKRDDSPPRASRLWRPPLVGIITALLMLVGIALGHAVMVMIQNGLGNDRAYIASIGIGALAVVVLWYGVKSRNESFATWTGFFSGLFVWMSWVEFFYMYYGRENFGLMPRVEDGRIGAEPEYLIMSATVGVLLTMLVYYTFDKDTRCNMFVWIQDRLGLRAGLGPSTKTARDRNYAIITFMETFYVTWFCYAWNLFIYDPAVFGFGMASQLILYATMFVTITWGGFCFSRLLRYRRTSTALRYAIPTANILWINVELFSKLGLLTEVWLQPQNYVPQIAFIVLTFTVLAVMIVKAPKKPSEVGG